MLRNSRIDDFVLSLVADSTSSDLGIVLAESKNSSFKQENLSVNVLFDEVQWEQILSEITHESWGEAQDIGSVEQEQRNSTPVLRSDVFLHS